MTCSVVTGLGLTSRQCLGAKCLLLRDCLSQHVCAAFCFPELLQLVTDTCLLSTPWPTVHELQLPALHWHHDPMRARRIGEASHPGPAAAAATRRRRAEKESPLEDTSLTHMLRPMLEKMLKDLLQQLLGSQSIGVLLSGLVGNQSKPKRKKKPKKPKYDPTKFAWTGKMQITQGKPTDTEPVEERRAKKGKGKGLSQQKPDAPKPSTSTAPAKAKGKGKDRNDEWTVVQRKQPRGEWQLRQQDWDGDIIKYDEVAQKLRDATSTFKAVVLVTNEQVEVLKTILDGDKKAYGITAVVVGATEGAEKVPGEVQGKLSFRTAKVWQLWSTGVQCPRARGGESVAFKVKPKETVVIAARIFERFVSQASWAEAKHAPQKFVHKWFASHSLRAEDSWGWQLEKVGHKGKETLKLFGLVKLTADTLPALLALSGDGIFFDATRQHKLQQHYITWVEQIKGEADDENLARARRMGSALGIVMGRVQLGFRTAGKPAKPLPRVWVAEAIPSEWDAETTQALLAKHFEDVQLLSQRRRRKECDVFFKAAAKEDTDLVPLPVTFGDAETKTMLWARWAPPRKVPSQCQQLQRLPRWDLRAEPKRTGLAAAVPIEATKGSEDGKALPAAKRAAVETRDVPHNTEVKAVAGDGSCLYHSFAGAMMALHDIKLDPLTLRAEVITHLGKHKERYVQQWTGEAPDGTRIWSEFTSTETKEEAFSKYLDLSKPSTAWAGELEASVLGRQYDTKIIIVPRVASFRLACLHKKGERTVALWFTGEHFDFLLPKQGKHLPQELANVVDDLTYDIRAGGKSKAETVWTSTARPTRKSGLKRSVRPDTVWTTTTKQPTESAKKVRRPCTVWTQDSEQNLDGFDLATPQPSAPSTSLTSSKSPFATDSGFQATCIYCPWVYKSECRPRVTGARRDHYLRAHPGQPM
eukprot:Skav200256  [mRNA]  locus=scaffold128:246598:249372:+ [translate_table: standard]